MLEKSIEFFVRRHLLTTFILAIVFIGGVFFWQNTIKEDMPDVSFNIVQVTARYPGATPDEVEYFLVKPLEDALRSVDGIYRVVSSSSAGAGSLTIELELDVKNLDSAVNEIKNAVLSVRMPDEVTDQPSVWLRRTTRHPVLNVAIVDTNHRLLKDSERRILQRQALTLESHILGLEEISEVRRTGYLQREMQVNLKPDKLRFYNIPVSTVIAKIRAHNLRQPAGTLEDDAESMVTLFSPLYTGKDISGLVLQAGFEGQRVRLDSVADVGEGFAKNSSIVKVNGYEAVILRAVKSGSKGVLDAVEHVREVARRFERDNLTGTGLKVFFMDDGSLEVRNRLSIIAWNSLIGFSFILIILFIFMDFRSGIWVALGIPFTFCFTMIVAALNGYTINNMTLAAAIIVMGMIVDDAIVIAENISRLESSGVPPHTAAVKGATEMVLPVVASVATTCAAFLPLLLMKGRFARMITVIPPIIFLMLGASLLESVFILPGHMKTYFSRKFLTIITFGLFPFFEKLFTRRKGGSRKKSAGGHWFFRVEDAYGRFLVRVLPRKGWLFAGFLLLLVVASLLFTTRMRYVMFPNEEATEVRLLGATAEGTKRSRTAELARQVESVVEKNLGKEVIGFRTDVALSRRGGVAEEHRFIMSIEVVSPEKRKKSLNQLIREWEKEFEPFTDFTELRFSRQRFGTESGSPIELVFMDNDDEARRKAVNEAFRIMAQDPVLANVEVERVPPIPEYRASVNRSLAESLGIDVTRIALTLRTILGGTVAYEIPSGDEEIPLKVSVDNESKDDIEKILDVPVENKGRYLVPLGRILSLRKGMAPSSISREDYRRVTKLYADIAGSRQIQEKETARSVNNNNNRQKPAVANQEEKMKEKGSPETIVPAQQEKKKPGRTPTPLEIAERYEKEILPALAAQHPSTLVYFGGEVQNSRESQGEFQFALWLVIGLIYMILALLFNSAVKPFIILLSVPFGVVGVILAFQLHGITQYGFFAVIGVLGLLGVVVNNAIVMITRLDQEFEGKKTEPDDRAIADVARTRLRAVILTTLTTVAGLFPTAYGIAGYDSMLAEMMLALGWGLIFSSLITLLLVPSIYSVLIRIRLFFKNRVSGSGLKKAALPVIILLAGFATLSHAQESASHEKLTLEAFLYRAQEANPVFATFLIDAVNAEYAKVLKSPAADFVLSLAARSRLHLDGTSPSPVISGTAGLPLPFAGMSIGANFNSVLGESPVSGLELAVSAAVLKNMFGRSDRLKARSAELESRIAAYKVLEACEDYYGVLATLYYDWYASWVQLGAARSFHEENLKLLENIRRKSRESVADAADVARIELQVREKRNALVSASNIHGKYTRRIREVLGTEEAYNFLPSAPVSRPDVSGVFGELFAGATNRSRTWKIMALSRRKNADDLAILKDDLLPSVDFGVTYSKTFQDAALPQAASDGPGLKLSFALPAFRRTSAVWKIGQGEAKKLDLTLRGSSAAYRTVLLNLYGDLETEKRLIGSMEEAIRLSEKILEAERRNYNFGRITLIQYIAAVNDLEKRKLDKMLKEINLEKARLDWQRLTDTLVTELPGAFPP